MQETSDERRKGRKRRRGPAAKDGSDSDDARGPPVGAPRGPHGEGEDMGALVLELINAAKRLAQSAGTKP